MDISNVIPADFIANSFRLPNELKWFIFFIILLLGYISFKQYIHRYKLKEKYNTIDELILIGIYGLNVFTKLFFIIIFLIAICVSYLQDFPDYISLIIICIYVLSLILIALYKDIKFIRFNEKITKEKKKIFKITIAEFLFINSIFFVILFIIIYFYNIENQISTVFMFFAFFSLFAFNPLIYHVGNWFRKLNS
jgi:hypothetical protein